MHHLWTMALASLLISGCASQNALISSNPSRISFPALSGWYDDKKVIYITTDVSDAEIAIEKNANHASRLADALPDTPKHPGQRTVLERAYIFTNYNQGSVFASAPHPTGSASQNAYYSPIWQLYKVTWADPSQAHTMKSEEAVFKAEDAGKLKIEATTAVVNCPIIAVEGEGILPNTWLKN